MTPEQTERAIQLLKSAISLWGFMRYDPRVPVDERRAAIRKYSERKTLLKELEAGNEIHS